MCRITIAHTIRHRFTKSLFAKLEIGPIDTYYSRRLLRWAGHISWYAHVQGTAQTIDELGRKTSPSREPPNDVGPGAQQGPPSCRRPFLHIHQVAGPRCIP